MAYDQQKHTPSSDVRRGPMDIKAMVLGLTENIIISSKGAIQSNDINVLMSWGGEIEAFDAFIRIYYDDDTEYQQARNRFLKNVNYYYNTARNTVVGRRKIFLEYIKLFSMICKKLARFKIFPPLPVSYAQRIGQMVEVE